MYKSKGKEVIQSNTQQTRHEFGCKIAIKRGMVTAQPIKWRYYRYVARDWTVR